MIKILDKVFRGSHGFIFVLALMSQLVLAVEDHSPTIIQPGGSIRDEEVIAAADENNIAMVFTATRHFRH